MDTRLPSPSVDPKGSAQPPAGDDPSVNSVVQDLVTMSRDILRENVELQLLLTQYAEGILESTLRKVEEFSHNHARESESEGSNTRPSGGRTNLPRAQDRYTRTPPHTYGPSASEGYNRHPSRPRANLPRAQDNIYARTPPLPHAYGLPSSEGYNTHPSGVRTTLPRAQDMYARTPPSYQSYAYAPSADGYRPPSSLTPSAQTTDEYGVDMHSTYSRQSALNARNAGFDHAQAPPRQQHFVGRNIYTHRPSSAPLPRAKTRIPITARSATSSTKSMSYKKDDPEKESMMSSVFGWIRERVKPQIDIPSYLHDR